MVPPQPWAADSALANRVWPSPNQGERLLGRDPDTLILHYTGMADGPSALAWLCEPVSQVSCHYLVEEDGMIVQLVPEARRAWCAGRSIWAGEIDMNSASINIEIVNGGHDFGLPPFPDRQVAGVIALCRDVVARNRIPPELVLAHSDVAPARKQDPGERFPWRDLADAGVGVWVAPGEGTADVLMPGMSGEAVAGLQAGLARYGYGIDVSARYDAATAAVVRAFQRRFRPSRVSGEADAGTLDTLSRLLDVVSAARAPGRAPA